MGRRWNRYQAIGIGVTVLTVALAPACAAQRPARRGGGVHVISIGMRGIEPETLTARPGETVVWDNATSWSDVLILFEKGKGVSQACANTVGFFRPTGGDYTTGLIYPGQEVSLCIAAPGMYEYQVHLMRAHADSIYRGKIVVQ